ncbi:MAG: cation diffusion facilitator family transporter [Acidimicrobiia bacterium]|nr:cation diffusion facilitator family transporter [Acidimicrobiia bacterium]
MTTTHTHVPRAGQRHLKPLAIAFALVVIYMGVEIVAGVLTGSLALLSDAGHMATDALGLGMALAAIVAANRAATTAGRTYGLYRLEILAALANSALLLGVAVYVIIEAVKRLQDPPEVLAGPMLIVAVVGLVVNIAAWRLLRSGAEESLNVKGAYYEVVADLAGSVGVIVAAVIVIGTGWPYADALFAGLIGLFILPRAWRLGHQAFRILVQAAPIDLDLEAIRSDLARIEGVVDVHDLHVWTLTSEMDVATVHIMTTDDVDPHPVLDAANTILEGRYGISHATLQIEPDTHHGCAEVTW